MTMIAVSVWVYECLQQKAVGAHLFIRFPESALLL